MKVRDLPFNTKRWKASSTVRSLTSEQRSWYFSLLVEAWEGDPQGYLRVDIPLWKLALAESEERWDSHSGPVLKKFERDQETGRLFNPEMIEITQKLSRNKQPNDPSLGAKVLAQRLADLIHKNNPNARVTESQLAAWASESDLMLRRDGRTSEQIKAVIEWSQADAFWFKNILGMKKLRKQFDRLWLEVKRTGPAVRQDDGVRVLSGKGGVDGR